MKRYVTPFINSLYSYLYRWIYEHKPFEVMGVNLHGDLNPKPSNVWGWPLKVHQEFRDPCNEKSYINIDCKLDVFSQLNTIKNAYLGE